MSEETGRLIEWAREWDRTATPAQKAEMLASQRESWIRAFAPCEHGDPDWETCPHCLQEFANKRKDPEALTRPGS